MSNFLSRYLIHKSEHHKYFSLYDATEKDANIFYFIQRFEKEQLEPVENRRYVINALKELKPVYHRLSAVAVSYHSTEKYFYIVWQRVVFRKIGALNFFSIYPMGVLRAAGIVADVAETVQLLLEAGIDILNIERDNLREGNLGYALNPYLHLPVIVDSKPSEEEIIDSDEGIPAETIDGSETAKVNYLDLNLPDNYSGFVGESFKKIELMELNRSQKYAWDLAHLLYHLVSEASLKEFHAQYPQKDNFSYARDEYNDLIEKFYKRPYPTFFPLESVGGKRDYSEIEMVIRTFIDDAHPDFGKYGVNEFLNLLLYGSTSSPHPKPKTKKHRPLFHDYELELDETSSWLDDELESIFFDLDGDYEKDFPPFSYEMNEEKGKLLRERLMEIADTHEFGSIGHERPTRKDITTVKEQQSLFPERDIFDDLKEFSDKKSSLHAGESWDESSFELLDYSFLMDLEYKLRLRGRTGRKFDFVVQNYNQLWIY